jgi:hypothetical protein
MDLSRDSGESLSQVMGFSPSRIPRRSVLKSAQVACDQVLDIKRDPAVFARLESRTTSNNARFGFPSSEPVPTATGLRITGNTIPTTIEKVSILGLDNEVHDDVSEIYPYDSVSNFG